jgi:hypothetical protein
VFDASAQCGVKRQISAKGTSVLHCMGVVVMARMLMVQVQLACVLEQCAVLSLYEVVWLTVVAQAEHSISSASTGVQL